MFYLGRINPFHELHEIYKNLVKSKLNDKKFGNLDFSNSNTKDGASKHVQTQWVKILKAACFEKNERFDDLEWDYRDYYRF